MKTPELAENKFYPKKAVTHAKPRRSRRKKLWLSEKAEQPAR
jgi:hypothetical protein